jgi:hypothetical protein
VRNINTMGQRNLRFIFIQLLFSLAIGQVAVKISDLVINKYYPDDYYYVYMHLALCTIVLSTSWVGFQISKSAGNTLEINTVFSLQYIVLLIDIFLVISYFIMVRGAEIDSFPREGKKILTQSPDTLNETFWSAVIFTMYLLWDIITKVPEIRWHNRNGKFEKETKAVFLPLVKRGWQTLVCLIAVLITYHCAANNKPSPIKTSLVDMVLILIFLTFRSLKQTIKREYKFKEDNIPHDLKVLSHGMKEVTISDRNYRLKFIIIKILPVYFCIMFLLLLYILKSL